MVCSPSTPPPYGYGAQEVDDRFLDADTAADLALRIIHREIVRLDILLCKLSVGNRVMDSTLSTVDGDGHLTVHLLYAGVSLCVIIRRILKVGLHETSVNIITPLRVLGGIIVKANHTIFSTEMIVCVGIIVIEHDVTVLVIHIVWVHCEIELSLPFLTSRNHVGLTQGPETRGHVFLTDSIHIFVQTFDFFFATLMGCLFSGDGVHLAGDPVGRVNAVQVTALTGSKETSRQGDK